MFVPSLGAHQAPERNMGTNLIPPSEVRAPFRER